MSSVFIIEDHHMTSRGLADYLASSGIWTIAGIAASFAGAKESLESLAPASRPDVIILDLQLGKESGFEVLAWLHSQAAFRTTPVLVFSQFDDTAHRNAALQLGAQGYVSKGEDNEAFAKALEKVLYNKGRAKKIVLAGQDQNGNPENPKDSLEAVLERLTPRETEILLLTRQGKSTRTIAASLNISPRTVENHLSCIHDKTGLRNRDIKKL
jgi:DNA-binding NarL/FixJ family response regulator